MVNIDDRTASYTMRWDGLAAETRIHIDTRTVRVLLQKLRAPSRFGPTGARGRLTGPPFASMVEWRRRVVD